MQIKTILYTEQQTVKNWASLVIQKPQIDRLAAGWVTTGESPKWYVFFAFVSFIFFSFCLSMECCEEYRLFSRGNRNCVDPKYRGWWQGATDWVLVVWYVQYLSLKKAERYLKQYQKNLFICFQTGQKSHGRIEWIRERGSHAPCTILYIIWPEHTSLQLLIHSVETNLEEISDVSFILKCIARLSQWPRFVQDKIGASTLVAVRGKEWKLFR